MLTGNRNHYLYTDIGMPLYVLNELTEEQNEYFSTSTGYNRVKSYSFTAHSPKTGIVYFECIGQGRVDTLAVNMLGEPGEMRVA